MSIDHQVVYILLQCFMDIFANVYAQCYILSLNFITHQMLTEIECFIHHIREYKPQ